MTLDAGLEAIGGLGPAVESSLAFLLAAGGVICTLSVGAGTESMLRTLEAGPCLLWIGTLSDDVGDSIFSLLSSVMPWSRSTIWRGACVWESVWQWGFWGKDA